MICLFYRPQVPGAITGSLLGEAAHRLVKNTLNIKQNGSSSRLFEQPPYRNGPGNHTFNRSRPAGPSSYDRGYGGDPNYYYGHYDNQQGLMSNPRYPFPSNGVQNNRQNFKTQDRGQYHDLRTGISAVTIEENVRSRPPAVIPPRMPNPGQTPNLHHQFEQNLGPLPSPPSKWINKAAMGDAGMCFRQETTPRGANEKQVKQVYQVKTRAAQETSDPVF